MVIFTEIFPLFQPKKAWLFFRKNYRKVRDAVLIGTLDQYKRRKTQQKLQEELTEQLMENNKL